MRNDSERADGVTYVGARAFAGVFCAVCGIFLAVFFGIGRLTDPLDAAAGSSLPPVTVAARSAVPAPASVAAARTPNPVGPAMPLGASTAAPVALRYTKNRPQLPRGPMPKPSAAVLDSPAHVRGKPSLAKFTAPSRIPPAAPVQFARSAPPRPAAMKALALRGPVKAAARPVAVTVLLPKRTPADRGIKIKIVRSPARTATAEPAGAGMADNSVLVPLNSTGVALGTGQLTPQARNSRDSLVVAAPPVAVSQPASARSPGQ